MESSAEQSSEFRVPSSEPDVADDGADFDEPLNLEPLRIVVPESPACPSLGEIEQAVEGGQSATDNLQPGMGATVDCRVPNAECRSELLEHLRTCERCAALAEEVRRNQSFLKRLAEEDSVSLAHSVADGSFADSLPLEDIEGYGFLGTVHSGGQAVVYEAIQRSTGRKVALKMLLRGPYATLAQRERFQRGVELAAMLHHPNIVTIHDSGETPDGRHYCVMEYVRGRPLDTYLAGRKLVPRKGRPPRTRAAMEAMMRLFARVCDAVQCAHDHGVIHRDVKPGNILVEESGEPHLCDFGLAIAEESTQRAAAPAPFAGTFAYTPPEQLSSSTAASNRQTDTYALGVTLYEVLTGSLPYARAASVRDLLSHIECDGCPAPWSVAKDVDRDLGAIALKAIHRDPQRRYPSAKALREDVERWIRREAVEPRRGELLYRVGKFVRRHWPALAAAAGAALAFTLLLLRAAGA